METETRAVGPDAYIQMSLPPGGCATVKLNWIETVNIGLAREPWGIIKRDLRCDMIGLSSAMQIDMCSCRRAPLSTALNKSALTKARNFGTILDFMDVVLFKTNDCIRVLWSNGIFIELRSIKWNIFKFSHRLSRVKHKTEWYLLTIF